MEQQAETTVGFLGVYRDIIGRGYNRDPTVMMENQTETETEPGCKEGVVEELVIRRGLVSLLYWDRHYLLIPKQFLHVPCIVKLLGLHPKS